LRTRSWLLCVQSGSDSQIVCLSAGSELSSVGVLGWIWPLVRGQSRSLGGLARAPVAIPRPTSDARLAPIRVQRTGSNVARPRRLPATQPT
jgi:hypothetical protein